MTSIPFFYSIITTTIIRVKSRNRNCRRNDQRLFNSNLLKEFYSEYSRVHPLEKILSDKIVLDWKFSQLDANKDDKIHKLEFREMRRLVRKVVKDTKHQIFTNLKQFGEMNNFFLFFEYKVVKPKRCARLFGKQLNCDIDFDEKLSRQEWMNCLNKDRFIGKRFIKSLFLRSNELIIYCFPI